MLNRGIVLSVLVLTMGCAGAGTRSASSAEDDKVVARAMRDAEAQKEEYRIGPRDLLLVAVYREDDLRKEARVSSEGIISFPMAGEIEVGGLTALEAEARLKDRLKGALVDPEVSVEIKEYRQRKVYILGEVAKPGSLEIPPDRQLTVVEAIALAGGFTKFAAGGRTRVVRKAGTELRSYVIQVNKVMDGDKSKDMALAPNDVVYVPETLF
jgi:polysaccharide export outer membrane protein